MDDLLVDGGTAATTWQRRHARRKAREAQKKIAALTRAEAKRDLAKRTRKWREKWNAKAAANKAAGLPPPSKHGRPRDIKRSNVIDMAGMRFGKLTVVRIAPVSKSGGQRCRRWWVKCDCGHAEHLVNGTCLRQGIARSCGCLKADVGRAGAARRRAERERLSTAPLSDQLAALRHKILAGKRIIRADAKLLRTVRSAIIEQEIAVGIRRRRNYRKRSVETRTTSLALH